MNSGAGGRSSRSMGWSGASTGSSWSSSGTSRLGRVGSATSVLSASSRFSSGIRSSPESRKSLSHGRSRAGSSSTLTKRFARRTRASRLFSSSRTSCASSRGTRSCLRSRLPASRALLLPATSSPRPSRQGGLGSHDTSRAVLQGAAVPGAQHAARRQVGEHGFVELPRKAQAADPVGLRLAAASGAPLLGSPRAVGGQGFDQREVRLVAVVRGARRQQQLRQFGGLDPSALELARVALGVSAAAEDIEDDGRSAGALGGVDQEVDGDGLGRRGLERRDDVFARGRKPFDLLAHGVELRAPRRRRRPM